jgi:hypothetical protein
LLKKPGLDKSVRWPTISHLQPVDHIQAAGASGNKPTSIASSYFRVTELLLTTSVAIIVAATTLRQLCYTFWMVSTLPWTPNEPRFGRSVDIVTASFDTLCHHTLLRRLESVFGIPDVAASWLRSYLPDRQYSFSTARPLLACLILHWPSECHED